MSDYARLKQHYGEWMTIEDIQGELKVDHVSVDSLMGLHYKLRFTPGTTRRHREYNTFDVSKMLDRERGNRDIHLCKTCMFSGAFSGKNGMIYCDYATKVGVSKSELKRRGLPDALNAMRCPLYIKGERDNARNPYIVSLAEKT